MESFKHTYDSPSICPGGAIFRDGHQSNLGELVYFGQTVVFYHHVYSSHRLPVSKLQLRVNDKSLYSKITQYVNYWNINKSL